MHACCLRWAPGKSVLIVSAATGIFRGSMDHKCIYAHPTHTHTPAHGMYIFSRYTSPRSRKLAECNDLNQNSNTLPLIILWLPLSQPRIIALHRGRPSATLIEVSLLNVRWVQTIIHLLYYIKSYYINSGSRQSDLTIWGIVIGIVLTNNYGPSTYIHTSTCCQSYLNQC